MDRREQRHKQRICVRWWPSKGRTNTKSFPKTCGPAPKSMGDVRGPPLRNSTFLLHCRERTSLPSMGSRSGGQNEPPGPALRGRSFPRRTWKRPPGILVEQRPGSLRWTTGPQSAGVIRVRLRTHTQHGARTLVCENKPPKNANHAARGQKAPSRSVKLLWAGCVCFGQDSGVPASSPAVHWGQVDGDE